jgi:hypothetical protein
MAKGPEEQGAVDQSTSASMGKLIGEFGDFWAPFFKGLGYVFGALGTFLLAVAIFRFATNGPFTDEISLGITLAVVGTGSFAIGKLRQKKRLLIYQGGIVQIKWRKVDAFLWRDLRQMQMDRETRYDSGLASSVRYHCSLQHGDGTWLALNAIRITSEAAKAIRQSAVLANPAYKGNVQDFHG